MRQETSAMLQKAAAIPAYTVLLLLTLKSIFKNLTFLISLSIDGTTLNKVLFYVYLCFGLC